MARPRSKIPKQKVYTTLDAGTFNRLDQHAQSVRASRSQIIALAIDQYLDQQSSGEQQELPMPPPKGSSR